MSTASTESQRIALALSGGVDSAVAALLLKRAGHEVVGVFIKSWEDDGSCPAGADAIAAAAVADHVGIDLLPVDLTTQYRAEVFGDFLDSLRAGHTPNPDVWCNSVIKFGHFATLAFEELGAGLVATGHYACLDEDAQLLQAEDGAKDQSYFLYRVPRERLERAIFPLGRLRKKQVREIAAEAGLPNSERAESMGICFVGKRKLKDFLAAHIDLKEGPIVDEAGNELGRHAGAPLYTVGQRHGLRLGGPGKPWYVLGKDAAANVITVGRGHDHPALFSSQAVLGSCHWGALRPPKPGWVYTCRWRHLMEPAPCTLGSIDEDGNATVDFAAPQRAVAPGQAAVIYDGNLCLGGGTVQATFPRP